MLIRIFVVDFLSIQLLIFSLVIAYSGTPQIAPDRSIFVNFFPGEHAPGPPSNNVTSQCYGHTCYVLSL